MVLFWATSLSRNTLQDLVPTLRVPLRRESAFGEEYWNETA